MPEEADGGGASQSTEPAAGTSAATDVSLKEYLSLRSFWQWRFYEERDRRYAEVQIERDKAEVIRAATQAYRDEKANELREQISEERGRYVSQSELTGAMNEIKAILDPVVKYIHAEQGSKQGTLDFRQLVAWGIAAALGILALAQWLM